MLEHYSAGLERDRLTNPLGQVEFQRTKEIVEARLSPPPATVVDVGGGPGRYSLWLAGRGYTVIHRDVVPSHIEEVREAASAAGVDIDAEVGDARELDVGDETADAVLLLGPLYHLTKRTDRLRALHEVYRILRPLGVGFAAVISRWAPRLHGVVVDRMYQTVPGILEEVVRVERTGRLPPLDPTGFAGFCHRPPQLRREINDAGLECVDVQSVEGIAFALSDLDDRLSSEEGRAVVLETARRTSRVPELLGLGPHLLATARRAPERGAGIKGE